MNKLISSTKKIFSLSILISILFLSQNLIIAQWVQIGPPGGTISCVTRTSSGNFFAGTDNGVFISSNNGISWDPTPFSQQTVQGITSLNMAVYAATLNGIYKSTNNGQNWILTPLNIYVNKVVTRTSNIYAGTNTHGIYLSSDGGSNWVHWGLDSQTVNDIAFNNNYIFAGTWGRGVCFSTDNGVTWNQTSLNIPVICLATINSYVYAGTNIRLYASSNLGQSWNQVSINSGASVNALAVLGPYVFAGTSGIPPGSGIFISSNNGINWVQSSLNNKNITSIFVNGDSLYATTINYGIFKSSNFGQNWVATPINCQNVNSVLAGNTIIFSGGSSGVFFSTNSGLNWNQTFDLSTYSLSLNNMTVLAGTLYLSMPAGIYRSSNNGINFIPTSINDKNIYSIFYRGTNIFAGTYVFGVYLSIDDGINWVQSGLNTKNVLCFASNSSTIFAGTYFFGVYTSTNNGQTWTQTSLNSQNVRTLAIIGQNIFAGTDSYGIYISTNNGTSWAQTSINNQTVLSFASSGNILFAGTDSNGVYMTTNNGISWVQKNEGMGRQRINSLYTSSDYIYAGTQGSSVWRRPLPDIISVNETGIPVPDVYSLSQNYPNPFNPSTTINYQLPKSGFVKLSVFDVLGQEVKVLVNENKQAGSYNVKFDASELPSGVYFYKIQSDDFTSTKKMTLIK